MQKVLLLRRVDLLAALPTRDIGMLVRHSREIAVATGELIIREGEPGQTLYVVIGGKVAVLHAGREVARLGEGEYFGEIAVLTGAAATATVTALEDTLLLSIDQRDFHALLANDFDAVLTVIRRICARLVQLGGLHESAATDERRKTSA